MAIWRSCNIDIPRSLNSHDSFVKRKFKNWALTSCRRAPILSTSTIQFELHAEIAEEINLQKCNFWQLSQLQKPCDFDLDLGLGQGNISINTTCSTTSTTNRVTVVSDSTKIWPCEMRVIWRCHEVWTPLIAFLEGNSKIGLQQAVDQVHTIIANHQFWAPRKNVFWWRRYT